LNGNEYEAQFTNSFGSVTTTPATLTVDFPAAITSNISALPVLISSNSTVTINAGASEMFTATASGNPAPTVTWEVSTTGAPGTYSAVTLGSTYSVTTTNPTATSTTSTLVITNAPITLNDDFYEAVFQNTLSGSPVPPPSTATTSPFELMVDAVPTITGTLLNQTVSDNATINPFAGVVLTGTDNPGETQNITVILSSTQGGTTPIVTNGTLTPGAGGSYLNGVFTDDGVTLAQAQADLRALVFTPTDHQVVPGATVTTFFTLEVATFSNSNPSIQVGSTVTDSGTSVIATAIASPTVITGTVAGQTVNDGATIKPFSSVVLTNPDSPSETHKITVTLSAAANGSEGVGLHPGYPAGCVGP
jgi:large repetitive protein